jgi:hypothetical protein
MWTAGDKSGSCCCFLSPYCLGAPGRTRETLTRCRRERRVRIDNTIKFDKMIKQCARFERAESS